MAAFEWHVDESRSTIRVIAVVALGLGALRPRHAMASGSLIGVAVAAMIGFAALSGIRPTYETGAQTLSHSMFWLVLLPALLAAAVGARIGGWLRPDRAWR